MWAFFIVNRELFIVREIHVYENLKPRFYVMSIKNVVWKLLFCLMIITNNLGIAYQECKTAGHINVIVILYTFSMTYRIQSTHTTPLTNSYEWKQSALLGFHSNALSWWCNVLSVTIVCYSNLLQNISKSRSQLCDTCYFTHVVCPHVCTCHAHGPMQQIMPVNSKFDESLFVLTLEWNSTRTNHLLSLSRAK